MVTIIFDTKALLMLILIIILAIR